MAQKQLLHELLEKEQEPFHLKSYIADRRSQFKKSTLQLGKRKTVVKSGHFCFFSFDESQDVRKSPFTDFHSPASMSPCKSPVFLRVPPRTAAVLVEAAVRIQKRQESKRMAEGGILGFGLLGGFLKRLKDRSKYKKRAIRDQDGKISPNCETKWNHIRLNNRDTESCSCEQSEAAIHRQCSLRETLLCSSPASPFRFSLHRSASSSGCRTPDFCSPVASPRQEKANSQTRNADNPQEDHEEEKEHCSPVSVLDSFFEDDEHEPEGDEEEEEEEDSDCDSSYANVQRVKQQLLYRLQRFEKLAELDPLELEKRLLESNSDDEYQVETIVSKDDCETFSPCRGQEIEIEVFDLSSLDNSRDVKRICSGGTHEVWGRLWEKLESWKDVEFIDMMIELDLKNECDGWRKFSDEVDEATQEVEVAIVGVLVEEVLEGCVSMDPCN